MIVQGVWYWENVDTGLGSRESGIGENVDTGLGSRESGIGKNVDTGLGSRESGIGENVVWGATHLSSYLFVTKQNPDRSNQDITLITSVLI